MMRNQIIVGLAILMIVTSALWGQTPSTSNTTGRRDIDRSIDRGIKFLRECQRDNGSIIDPTNQSGIHATALTSLSLLAFAAAGHTLTDQSATGDVMRRGLQFVLDVKRIDETGYFGHHDGSRMYGHGITTLMLGELLGTAADPRTDHRIRQRLTKGVSVILTSQQLARQSIYRGGWRYLPQSRDADMSVSIWQTMALRSAHNAELFVPEDAIDQALTFIKRCHNDNGFGYQPGKPADFSMTGAGLVALHVCGIHDAPQAKSAADWLLEHPPTPKTPWFYYGLYYYTQGMFQQGPPHDTTARNHTQRLLIKLQQENGSWIGTDRESEGGTVYCTALATMSLAVRYHYLPIYQR